MRDTFCDTLSPHIIPSNPYVLLTPGPLSTTKGVRAAMLKDWCTWDEDYNSIVQAIRQELVALASNSDDYTAVLMQGSGTFSVESALTTVMPKDATKKLLILSNGAYGERIATIAGYADIPHRVIRAPETQSFDPEMIEACLKEDARIYAVAMVHCETTTGILNPLEPIASVVKEHGRLFIVDAMSSFGGIPLDMDALGIDVLISSANKCIQGVPGFGFMLFKKALLSTCKGHARSLSLDAYAQWEEMEKGKGKWRFTSPTHVVRAFREALYELALEGGVGKRFERLQTNQRLLVEGMERLGFKAVIAPELQSPVITSFYSPEASSYDFKSFYHALKEKGFVIYPGKVASIDSFRIGTIGDVYPEDIRRLLTCIAEVKYW